MKRMQSPTPNRKGVYEIHDVPDRKVDGLKARGWKEVKAQRVVRPKSDDPKSADFDLFSDDELSFQSIEKKKKGGRPRKNTKKG